MSFLVLLLAYLAGSIPFGYILTKTLRDIDIRKHGSGNIGATNVLRVLGWRLALPVFILDMAKGFLPVMLAAALTDQPLVILSAGLLAMIGHSFPLYLKFKGGKAVATTIGVLLALSTTITLLVLGLFIIIVALTRYVSLGSMLCMLAVPVLFALFGYEPAYTYFGLAAALLVIARHHENIARLLTGRESKLGRKA